MEVVFIQGDGIGKEIAKSVQEINDVLNTGIQFLSFGCGAEYYEETGKLYDDALFPTIREKKIVLKGPTATPIGTGFRSINVTLRHEFETYANVRPIHQIKGIPSRFENVDLVIIRENTEDLYTGEEKQVDEDTAISIKTITRKASKRICEYAFEYAVKNQRKSVTCVHKANIMKLSDGLFLETFKEVAKNYPSIETKTEIVDALCMKLVTNPNQFDVLVAPNLYGDIISDLAAGLIGGLGFAPSVNVGDEVNIYEAVHGSAPDIAGKNLANPTALLLAYCLLLKDCGLEDKATKLENAIYSVIEKQQSLTQDMGGNASTTEYTQAIIQEMED